MLNDAQKKVVGWREGRLLVSAVPGSGKTRCVVHWIAELVNEGVDPERILAVTFTRKAAGEMNERLSELLSEKRSGKGVGGVRVGTFHSLCWDILKDGSPVEHWDFDSKDVMRRVLKQEILAWNQGAGMNWKDADLTKVEGWISYNKNELVGPEDAHHPYDTRFDEAYLLYEEERRSRQLLTFDDMLFHAAQFLLEDAEARERWSGRYSHVVIDEAQDTNHAQWVIMEILGEMSQVWAIVGDVDQCQPPDTKVQVVVNPGNNRNRFKEICLGDVCPGMRIRSLDRGKACLTSRRVRKVARRRYSGDLLVLSVGDNKTRTTPDHRVLVRWANNKKKNVWVVYLMYREDRGFRVGWCQMFFGEGGFHLGVRSRLEKADKSWILKVTHSKRDASVSETLISLKYSIPTAMFEPNGDIYNESALRRIFGGVSRKNGYRCLEDHCLLFNHPLWPIKPRKKGGAYARTRSTLFETSAANVLPGEMKMYTQSRGWQVVKRVQRELYNGEVISLDVEDTHKYIADGIAVNNCIYAWRSAHPERFSEFAEKFQAEIIGATLNYRSLPRIVESANRVIANNTKRIPQSAKPVREGEGVVQWRPVSDMDDEAATVLQWIREMREDGRKWRDFAILVRTNAQSRAFEEVFLREKVPYVVVGGVDFWKRREIKDLVAYLRLADDLHDDAAFLQTVNRPFRYIGKVTLEKITDLAEARGKPMFWIAENVELGLRSNQVRSLKEYCSIVREAEESLKCGRSLTEVLSTVIRRVNYMGWLVRDMGSDTAENSRVSNVKELLRTLHRFESVEELRKYLRDLNAEKRKRSEGEEADVVRIMSIHKSKGLEFPVVFLAGACEDIIPHAKSQDVEEERRLFYVAMTRAMDALYVTSPVEAFVGVEKKALEPSRFVKEAGLLDSRASVVEG